ncbi:MAG: hypothetical protein L0H75_06240, partial [Nitrosospira sp.]|nr:hypothetical protein [Nitrosospira sp.]
HTKQKTSKGARQFMKHPGYMMNAVKCAQALLLMDALRRGKNLIGDFFRWLDAQYSLFLHRHDLGFDGFVMFVSQLLYGKVVICPERIKLMRVALKHQCVAILMLIAHGVL